MSSRNYAIAFCAGLALLKTLPVASLEAADNAPKQPNLGVRAASLLKIGGMSFKDLNHNGALEPYEDWRLPAEKYVFGFGLTYRP
jgi:beta-glucosidase